LDYQGNTRKERDKAQAGPKQEKEIITKVVVGEVVQKPKGIGRKFKETFFNGDLKHSGEFVLVDVLLPALRNLVVDMASRGIEKVVYGESTRGPRRPQTNYNYSGTRYSVGGPTNPFARPQPLGQSYSPQINRGRQNRHDMNDIIVGTKEEADLVMERLIDILEKYDVVSLADLNELLGLETSHLDNKWGWTFLANPQVRQIRQGYLLELPPLEEI
jgi:hypothetical protein